MLLAVATLQIGTSSALVPADLVDTYADSGYVTPTTWFARGDTVYMRGGLAGSTDSYRFLVTDPTGALVHDSGCQVRNGSAVDAFDSYTLPSNAVLGAATGWTERFREFGDTTPQIADTTCTTPDAIAAPPSASHSSTPSTTRPIGTTAAARRQERPGRRRARTR